MEKIKIVMKNQETEVDVVRYFKLNNEQYLIFSLNEVDAQGYVKLYIEKVMLDNMTGNLSFTKVSDENEWNNIKDFIKEVIKSSKTGNMSVEDLNHNNLNGLSVTETRIFKLSSAFVDVLGANKATFTETNVDSVPETEVTTDQVTDNLEETKPELEVSTPETDAQVQSFEEMPEVNQSFEMTPETVASITPEEPTLETNVNMEFQNNELETNSEDYKVMFETEKTKNEELTNKITELENKLENIKNILGN